MLPMGRALLARNTARAGSSTARGGTEGGEKPVSVLGVGATGLAAGGLGSLAGMGGGFIAIPMMTHFGLSQHAAHGTSLVGVLATGGAGALAYAAAGDVDPLAAAMVASTGMLSARAGAMLASRLDASTLKKGLGVFMLAIAPVVPFKAEISAALGVAHPPSRPRAREEVTVETLAARCRTLTPPQIAPFLGIGLGAGLLSGLLGIGGGAVVVPLLTLATDMDYKLALGTSLAAMVPTAVAGVAAHASLGNVRAASAAPLFLGTCVGAYCGGRLAAHLPEEPMKLGFGAVMLVLGTRTLFKA